MIDIKVERADAAVVIQLPLDASPTYIEKMLDYAKYMYVVSKSKASTKQIDELSKSVKAGWSESVKNRLKTMEEFKDIFG